MTNTVVHSNKKEMDNEVKVPGPAKRSKNNSVRSKATEHVMSPAPSDGSNQDQFIQSMSQKLQSLTIQDPTLTNDLPACGPAKTSHSPYKEKSTNLNDQGLTCLLSQLARVNEQLRYNDSLKKVLVDYEEEYKRDLAASLAKSLVKKKDDKPVESRWVTCYDDEVGAEYFYNEETGEASWVDPNA